MKLLYVAALSPLLLASVAHANYVQPAVPTVPALPTIAPPTDWSTYQPPASGPTLEQGDPNAQPYTPPAEYQEYPGADLPTYEEMNPNTDPVTSPFATPELSID